MDPRYANIDFEHYNDDYDEPYCTIYYNKDGTIKKKKYFSTEEAMQQYDRYHDLKVKHKKNNISEDEFKEYELYLRRRFIIRHYDQFSKLKPYGRYKTITKIYNLKYNFNISDNTFKHYLSYNFNL